MKLFDYLTDPLGHVPVFSQELRTRWRHPWVGLTLILYAALSSAAGVYACYHYAAQATFGDALPTLTALAMQVGMRVPLVLFAAQFLLVSLLVPILIAGAFTTARAKRTLEPMLLTPLTSDAIAAGKLYGHFSEIVLLLVSTMPVCAVAGLFGGLAPGDLVSAYLLLLLYAFVLTAMGLYISCRTKTVGAALCWHYLGVLALFIGVPHLGLSFLWIGSGLWGTNNLAVPWLPLPLLVVPVAALCVLAARWFIRETVLHLDTERQSWGSVPPPLPLESRTASPATTPPPALATRHW